jgi:hypothetical protein
MAYTEDKLPSGLDAKATPVDADVVIVGDSADTNRAKKTTWAQVKSVLKTYFDTVYQPVATVLTNTTASFTTTLESKLGGIEDSADVTDAANVTSAGALMDSECTSLADVKALNQSVVSGASPTFGTANMTDATNKRFMTDAQESKLDGVEALADVTDAGNVGSTIHGSTGKTTPADADTTALIDSEETNVLKKVTWANIKATLKTYFDTLYTNNTGTVTSVAVSGSDGIEVDSGSPVTTSGTVALGVNKATLLSHLNVEDGADVTDATNVSTAGAPIISSGAGAPSSTPSKVGDVYIDTTGDDAYIAVGTASSSDWEKCNDGGGGASTFISLTDTPANYTASAGKAVKVNGAGDGLEFADFPAGTGDVTASSAFGTDNVLVRSDGTSKGIQATGISVADTTNDITGAGKYSGSGALLSGLTASEIVITDGSKNLASAPVATYPSLTELSYVKGVTSALQTQLGGKQATLSGATLTGVTIAVDDKVLIQDTSDTDNIKTVTTQAVANLATPEGTAIKSTGEAGGTKYLREDGDGTCSWQTVSAGSSEPYYIYVAATDASAREKAVADYKCDGTADEVQINLAIEDVRAIGGTVVLSSGNFAIAASVDMTGETAESGDNPQVRLLGNGIDSTFLNGASNINVIATGQRAKYEIAYMTLAVAGSGDGISQTAGTERGNWQSHVHDIFIKSDFTTHTGWGIDMQSPFRMCFTNIEMNGVANGMNLQGHTESFNAGNISIDRLFIDLWNHADNASAVGLKLAVTASDSTGVMNLISVNRLDIAGGSNLSSSVGISIVGSSSSYGDSRHHTFTNLNIEDVKTAIKLVRGRDCSFRDLNYVRVLGSGKIIELDANSHNNLFENIYAVGTTSTTFDLVTDANTSANLPNIIRRVDGYQPSSVTINATLATNTILEHVDVSGGSPTVDADITNRNNVRTFAGIELGHATDTTLTRASAGVVAIEGVNIVTESATQTLTNKTLTSPTLTTPSGFTTGGNITLAENNSVDLDPVLSADGKYTGMCITGTAGATLAFGDLVYLASADSRWELADADAASTAGTVLLGMCVLAASGDGEATKILLQGNIRADTAFPALTVGGAVYVGTTAGDVQTSAPTGADDVVRVVGHGLTADSMIFNPSPSHITHVGA